jgi:hypothetical protein
MADECDAYLAPRASSENSFLRSISGAIFLEWLDLADKCDLQQLLPLCIAHLVANWRVGLPE